VVGAGECSQSARSISTKVSSGQVSVGRSPNGPCLTWEFRLPETRSADDRADEVAPVP
jgi:hypothetical protein